MTNDTRQHLTRRAVLAASSVAGFAGLSGLVVAAPPKGVEPIGPETDVVVRKIDGMQRTIETIQDRLDSCDQDACSTVLEHSFIRWSLTSEAKASAVDHEWAAARDSLTEVKGIVEGDIDLLESVEDRGSIGDVLGLERALLNQTTSTLSVMPGDNVS